MSLSEPGGSDAGMRLSLKLRFGFGLSDRAADEVVAVKVEPGRGGYWLDELSTKLLKLLKLRGRYSFTFPDVHCRRLFTLAASDSDEKEFVAVPQVSSQPAVLSGNV